MLLAVMAALSMVLGNCVAITQRNDETPVGILQHRARWL